MSVSDIIKVLVVHPKPDIRKDLSQQLQPYADLIVVGQADCGEAALDLCRYGAIDVVIMDVVMPGLDGLTVTQLLRAEQPNIHVVIVTDIQEGNLVRIALRAGISGYLQRDTGSDSLAVAVRAAAVGLCTFAEQIAGRLAQRSTDDADAAIPLPASAAREQVLDLYYSLTHRERQIMRLVLLGYTSIEIGRQLYISPRTVEKHRANMMSKLDVHNQMELARLAYQLGLVPACNFKGNVFADRVNTHASLTLCEGCEASPLFEYPYPEKAKSG